MIKYTSNAVLAAKISLANEIGNLCKRLGVDSREVFTVVGMDGRVSPAFFRTGGIGFGGSCFPKDVRALIAGGARAHGEDLKILRAVLEVNEEQPKRLLSLLQRHIPPDLQGKTIGGVLGLAFKPDTDDVRESRAIPVVADLLAAGGAGWSPTTRRRWRTSAVSSRRSRMRPPRTRCSRPMPYSSSPSGGGVRGA
ncbi:hypothetical protein [Methanoculleus chikugoensis]|uniref:UDP binding domain-containing protein n=1 Tax=Methanoculleus chikugoensis TaxID=118126 RepID=UPI000A8EDBBF|nr:UDP binding domain-containing protein [Methanoculleus chikugoensis]